MVDRRSAPGGHWNDAYPFVRLHQPSRYYGVNSLALGGEAIETEGPEAGAMYERASGPAIQAYYARVMSERLRATDRVHFIPEHEWSGGRLVSLRSGESREVVVRKKVVDARFLSPHIPATTPPPFEVAAGASVIPVNGLSHLASNPERFVIIGAGKTALDACVWLLQNGVRPQAIQWIKPRETWLINRSYCQPETLVASLLEGLFLESGVSCVAQRPAKPRSRDVSTCSAR